MLAHQYMKKSALVMGLAIAGLVSIPASAAITTYYGFDAGAFGGPHPNSDAANQAFLGQVLPATVGVETFEGDSVGSFRGSSITLAYAPTGITGVMQGLATSVAEVSNVSSPGVIGSISATQYLGFDTSGNSTFFNLVLSAPRTAFGFYGASLSNYLNSAGGPFPPIQISLDGGAPIAVLNVNPSNIPGGSVNFFGVVSDVAFTTIRLINPVGTGGDGIGIDDITVAQAVPEPTSFLLFGVGLAALIWRAGRFKRILR